MDFVLKLNKKKKKLTHKNCTVRVQTSPADPYEKQVYILVDLCDCKD